MIIHYAVASVQGLVHYVHTDQFLICLGSKPLTKGGVARRTGQIRQSGALLAVCNGLLDGEYGQECAEVSLSEMETLLEGVEDYQNYSLSDGMRMLDEGMRRVHELLIQFSETREDGVQMMSTLAAIWFCKEYAVFSQVGNARIYRLSEQSLQLLTEDNTEAWALVKEGKISPDKLSKYPGHRVITQKLGGKGKHKPAIEVKSEKIEDNDVFLLCTAGLTDGISDAKIEEMLIGAMDSQGVMDMGIGNCILDFSAKAEGKHNSTLMLCQVFPDQSIWTDIIRNLG